MLRRVAMLTLCLLAALVLAACGGGGSGIATKPTLTFSALPAAVFTGQSVTFSWNAVGADTCTGSGAWSGTGPASGVQQIQIDYAGTFTFTLTCSGRGGSVSGSTTVTVTTAGTLPVTFNANPGSVAVGQSTTLTWAANGANNCIASGAWSGTLAASGSQSVVVSQAGDNIYNLSCSNASNNGTAQVIVQGLAASVNLSASPSTVGAGQSSTLTWSSSQAQSCTASGEWSGTLGSSGSKIVTPATVGNHTYGLTCSNPGVPASTSVTISAVATTINVFKAFPTTVTAGETVTLTWAAPTATSCAASGDWSGAKASSGRQTLTVSTVGTQQYQLDCSNAGSSDSKTANITIVAVPALPPATTFQIAPDHAGSIQFNKSLSYPSTATWSVNFSDQVSYPLIAGGRVFVTVANSLGGGSKLYALDQNTGATIWGPVQISGTYPWSNAAYADGKVFVVQTSGTMLSFDAATGTPGWSTQLPGQYLFSAPPTAFGGIVFTGGAGGGGTVYAVDASNGAVLWTQSVENGDKSSPAINSSGLYVTYPCQTYAFAPDSGAALWRNQNGCDGGGGRTSPVKNNVLYARYFSTPNNELDYFNATTGANLGTGSSDRIPAITATQEFVMNAGTLQAINLSNGQTVWSFAGDGQLVTAPIVINDRVIVGSGSTVGTVFAVDAATGTQLWSSTAGAPLAAPDEQNVSAPTSGMNAGEGFLIVPAGTRLTAWKLVP